MYKRRSTGARRDVKNKFSERRRKFFGCCQGKKKDVRGWGAESSQTLTQPAAALARVWEGGD